MSSRFVSGGTIGAGNTEASSTGSRPPAAAAAAPAPDAASKSAEWEKVQQHLEAERRQRQEARAQAASSGEGERSLYDVLQANKAAREAAAAEAAKLTNQFRALDDDEVAFLDEVVTRQRRAEESVRRETEDRLEAFRKAARKGTEGGGEPGGKEEEGWGTTRKRKRRTDKDGGGGGLVRRRVSVGEEVKNADKQEETHTKMEKTEEKSEEKGSSKKTALALVDYGSDSDE